MEKLKVQHDHTLTDILKVTIFGLMLILPLLVYAPTAFYYGFNEHAVEKTTVVEGGYEVRNKYETNEVNSFSDLVDGNIYKVYNNSAFYDLVYETPIYVSYTYFVNEDYGTIYELYSEDSIIAFETNINDEIVISNDTEYYTYTYSDYFYIVTQWSDYIQGIEHTNINIELSNYIPQEYVYNEEHEVTKDITQMMDQNWKELWQTDLFKWTNTSILKNGLDNFTGAFGVTDTSCITNLITYELIMVGIYVVIDIVIAMFKWLTHLIGTK